MKRPSHSNPPPHINIVISFFSDPPLKIVINCHTLTKGPSPWDDDLIYVELLYRYALFPNRFLLQNNLFLPEAPARGTWRLKTELRLQYIVLEFNPSCPGLS